MKSEKGITLMSLLVYIVIFMIILTVMGVITRGFVGNVFEIKEPVEAVVEFNKFSMLFISDVKKNKTYEIDGNALKFIEDGTVYTYKKEEKAIYRKVQDGEEVKIAKYINEITFTEVEDTNAVGKEIIRVSMKIGMNEDETIDRNVDFVLKYW